MSDCDDIDLKTYKYQVWHEMKSRDRAHLSDNGTRSFCGIQFYHNYNWCLAPSATLAEFIKDVRPRCSACLRNAKTMLAIDDLAQTFANEEQTDGTNYN